MQVVTIVDQLCLANMSEGGVRLSGQLMPCRTVATELLTPRSWCQPMLPDEWICTVTSPCCRQPHSRAVSSTPAPAGRPIVILADMEKEEMEEELRNHNIDFLGSHVVCRSLAVIIEAAD
jgi:hypothetical protein